MAARLVEYDSSTFDIPSKYTVKIGVAYAIEFFVPTHVLQNLEVVS